MKRLKTSFVNENKLLLWKFVLVFLILFAALLVFPITTGVHTNPAETMLVTEQQSYEFRILYRFLGALLVLLFWLIAVALKVRAGQDLTPINRVMRFGNAPASLATKSDLCTVSQNHLENSELEVVGFQRELPVGEEQRPLVGT